MNLRSNLLKKGMTMNNKALELAKKIYELTKRGIDGEKENAVLQLEKIMSKYNITMEDLESERIEMYAFKFDWDFYLSRKLLIQIIYMVLGENVRGNFYKNTKEKYLIYVKCTSQQKIEIEALYTFFKNNFKEDLKLFYEAFLDKNHLYPEIGLTEEELNALHDPEEILKRKQRAFKVANIMNGLEKHTFNEQLAYKGGEDE